MKTSWKTNDSTEHCFKITLYDILSIHHVLPLSLTLQHILGNPAPLCKQRLPVLSCITYNDLIIRSLQSFKLTNMSPEHAIRHFPLITFYLCP